MTFCPKCQTYLAPGDAACPACNAPRPPAEPITALWTAALDAPPAGPPLAAGDLLLVPTQPAGPAAAPSALHAFDLHAGRPRWSKTFPHALVSGLQTCQVCKTWQVLVALSSANLLHGQGALLALDANGDERWRWSPGARRVSAPALVCSDDSSRSSICFTADAHTLVILDLAMPDMDGTACFREIAKMEPMPRVLLATGHAGGGDTSELLEAGAVGVLQKPFSAVELSWAVARAAK